ncbi:hypothetical protein BV25DRAFT_1766947, partial [Artomyces pyxidatus]
GEIEQPFHLVITRQGCECDLEIQPSTEYAKRGSTSEEWIRTLFDHSTPSAYDDIETQHPHFHKHIRETREIPASEFSVSQELVEIVRDTWAAYFHPRTVRADPHKILVCGPQAHFGAHRDKPETGLVGSFLVGLGDSTQDRNFELAAGQAAYSALPGQWVAFHPDVPRRVKKLREGYRAGIAFKIFCEDIDAGNADADILERVRDLTDKLKPPFGLFLDREYCMNAKILSRFDAMVHAAMAARPRVDVHLLRVITQWLADVDHRRSDTYEFSTYMYPFTSIHVDAL